MSESATEGAGVIEFDPRGKTGSFLVHAGDQSPCAVTVTRRGILNVASPPRATASRFLESIDVFRAIAREKLSKTDTVGPLEVTAEDVRRWRRLHGFAISNDKAGDILASSR
jgi:hypothetical protein